MLYPLFVACVVQADAESLHRVNFRATQGNVTAIMGPSVGERRTLTDLMGERRHYGSFEGQIKINGGRQGSSYSENVAFVPRRSLYMPGLTYYEMLMYSARLRIANDMFLITLTSAPEAVALVKRRVDDVLEMMGLTKIKNRLIDERPQLRGELGGDLRRLSIAMEIIALPAVMILDDPLFGMDPSEAYGIMNRLKQVALRGHVVVCSMFKPAPRAFEMVDQVVLLSCGWTVFAGKRDNLKSHFCSKAVGYEMLKGSNLVDFVLDVASGVERPRSKREGYSAEELQEKLEQSGAFIAPVLTGPDVEANGAEVLAWLGYAHVFEFLSILRHTQTATVRALHVKFHEFEVIKKSVFSSIVIAVFVGMLMRNNGNFGYYALSLFGIPYGRASNTSGLLFFSCSIMFVQQVLNIHILCKKLDVFRSEQLNKICPAISFTVATLISELPFVVLYSMIFGNIIYVLTSLNVGYANWRFFNEVLVATAVTAFLSAASFASLFRKEFVVRDLFLVCVFLMLLTSGFPFQFSGISPAFVDIAAINPIRWAFETLMVWKYAPYEDGEAFLTPYAFQDFHKETFFDIIFHFIVFASSLFLFSVLPPFNFLGHSTRDTVESGRTSTGSIDATNSRSSMNPGALLPVVFSREPSHVSGGGQLSICVSASGEAAHHQGATVTVSEITYRIKDILSPAGERTVLQNVSGQFDWGKLSMILGGASSGRSTLLRVMAGEVGYNASVTGQVLWNFLPVNDAVRPWQRCAFVEAHDEHFRDLTVLDTLTFAMKLRCLNKHGLAVLDENVSRTLEILNLGPVKHKKTKALAPGDLRRLSIAEEIVHGPSVLLIDEPTTGLDIRDISTMLMTFREMVNNDKTVVATMHQPSADVFRVFDTVLLLAKGRCIYHGSVENAVPFFVESPFGFNSDGYTNPADFILDVSNSAVLDKNEDMIASPQLAGYYQNSSLFLSAQNDTSASVELGRAAANNKAAVSGEQQNPLLRSGSPDPSDEKARKDSIQQMNEGMKGHGKSFDVGVDDDAYGLGLGKSKVAKGALHDRWWLHTVANMVSGYVGDVRSMDVETYAWQTSVLLQRSVRALWQREKLWINSTVLFASIALLLGLMLGDTDNITSSKTIEINDVPTTITTTTYEYNTTAFFAISMLLLVFANIQLVFYWMQSNEVFFKENARGLVSNIQYWLTASPALYILRVFTTVVFASIVYPMLELRKESGACSWSLNCVCVCSPRHDQAFPSSSVRLSLSVL